jgi:asparagine synthetase B (glutamine-hydrolysing)
MGIQHRGPDTSHFHVHLTHGGARMVVIGFHRLAINGSQPHDEQPFVGRLFNVDEQDERYNRRLTNNEIYTLLDPKNDDLPYAYDNFEWPHCSMLGYDMSNLQ